MNHCVHQAHPPSDRVSLRHGRDEVANRLADPQDPLEVRSSHAHSATIPDLGRRESSQVASRRLRVTRESLPSDDLGYDQHTDLEHHSSVSRAFGSRQRVQRTGGYRRRSLRADSPPTVAQVINLNGQPPSEETRNWIASGGRRMTLRHDYRVPRTEPVVDLPLAPVQEAVVRQRVEPTLQEAPPPSCLDIMSSVGSIGRSAVNRTIHTRGPVVQPTPAQAPMSLLAPAAAAPRPPPGFTLGPVNRARLRAFAGDGTEEWLSYVIHLRVVAAANCWDANLTKVMLMSALTGQALLHLRTIPDLNEIGLEDLLDTIQREFGRPEPRMSLIARLNNRVQGPQESYQALSRDIRGLVQRAYPLYSLEDQEDAACIRFCEAIRDQEVVGFHVRHMPQHECMQDLVDEANLVSQIHKPRLGNQRQSRQGAVNAVAGLDSISEVSKGAEEDGVDIADLIAKVQSIESRQIASLDARTCWNCRGKGHISYDCPEPKRPRDDWNGKKKSKKKNKKGKTESSSDSEQNTQVKKAGESRAASGPRSIATQTSKEGTGASPTSPGNGV